MERERLLVVVVLGFRANGESGGLDGKAESEGRGGDVESAGLGWTGRVGGSKPVCRICWRWVCGRSGSGLLGSGLGAGGSWNDSGGSQDGLSGDVKVDDDPASVEVGESAGESGRCGSDEFEGN